MNKLMTVTTLILFAGCGDSTGPSQEITDNLVVINTSTGGVVEAVNLGTSGCYQTSFSSDGKYLYIVDRMNLISKLDLSSLDVTLEQSLPGNSTYLINSALSGNDSLLFVTDSNEKLYKITTADMALTDTLTLDLLGTSCMETRPGTDLLYLCINDSQILVFDTSNMIFTDTLNVPNDYSFVFSDSGDEIYLCRTHFIYAYDPDTGQQIRSQFFYGGVLTKIEVPNRSNSIFLKWWNLSCTNPEYKLIELDRRSFAVIETLENSSNPTFIRYANSLSRLFLYPTEDNNISVADMPGFQPTGEIEIDEYVKRMEVSPSQDRLYCMVYYNSDQDVTE